MQFDYQTIKGDVCPNRNQHISGRTIHTSVFLVMMLSFVIGLLFSSAQLSAQVGTADVLGTVTDSTGAVLQNAKVTIKNLGTTAARTTVTNDKGGYIFTTLPNGTYSLTVEMAGFKSYSATGFSLSTGDRARYDAKLDTGEVTETVQVTADTATMQTDSSSVGSTIEPKAVQDLPMANRNIYAVAQLQPGISTGGSTNYTSGGQQYDRRPSSTIVANGQSDTVNDNLVNGFDNNEVAYGNTGVRPTVDGIEEMKVESTNAAAEFGRAAGAVVNVITKSGTNSFHGSLFEYLRNQATDSRAYNFYSTSVAKPPYHQNNFGGSFGGPIIKNKTFFFFGIENDRINESGTATSYVPTDEQYAAIASGSDYTSLGVPTGTAIAPFMLKMYQLYPKANNGTENGVGIYSSSPVTMRRTLDWELRIDHHFSANDIFFARYANNPSKYNSASALPSVDGVSPGGQSASDDSTNTQNLQLDYVHIINSGLLLDLKAGYTRYNSQALGPNVNKGIAAEFGIPNAVAKGAIGDDLPQVGGPSWPWLTIGGPNEQPYHNIENAFQYAGSLTYTHGSHEFKFGGGIIRRQAWIDQVHTAAGFILCSDAASCLEGLPIFLQRQTPVYDNNYRGSEFSGYAQDNYRVTAKLTLNIGIRYDVFTPYSDAKGYTSNFNASTLSDGLALDAHNFILHGTGGVNNDYGALAPRIGFAYSLTPKMVVRGGFGLTYMPFVATPGPGVSQVNAGAQNPPYYFNYQVYSPDLKTTAPWVNPTAVDLTSWNTNSALSGLVAMPTNTKDSRIFQTNMAVQRELGANTITLAYVGVFGRNQANNIDLNKPDMPGAGNATPDYVYTSNAMGTKFGSSNGVLDYVTSIGSWKFNGYSNYDALQVIYSRQLTKGLNINGNYTWAHALSTVGGATSSGGPGGGNANNSQLGYGNSQEDIRHRIAITGSYTLPFGKSYNGLKGTLIKGWQLNNIFQWQTGQPYTVVSGVSCDSSVDSRCSATATSSRLGYTNQPGQSYSYPNVVGKMMVKGKLNYAAFAPQEPGTQGNEAPFQLYGNHSRHDDLSLFKTFQLTGRFGLQFRAEAFNVSNTPSFGPPATYNIGSWTQSSVTPENPTGLIASSDRNFGVVNSTSSDPRRFQFALKLMF
jgi:hypothetical protein